MKLSVVIPTLNEAAHIVGCLECVHAAGIENIIVVDGGSDDDTRNLAEQAGAVVIQSPAGRATQQNLGASRATGDVVLFLHADCRLPADAADQVQTALAEPSSAIGGCFQQRVDASGVVYRWLERGNAFRARWLKWAYGDQGIFLKRCVFERVGGFPDLPFMEDLKLMQRLKREGSIRVLPGPLTVSARRWKNRGPVRQTFRNWALITAAMFGMSPKRLVRHYPHDR